MFVDTQEAAKVSANPHELLISYLRKIRELIGDESRHCRFNVYEFDNNSLSPVRWCLMGAADRVQISRGIVSDHCRETIELHPEIFAKYVNMAPHSCYASKPVNVNNFAPHAVTMQMIDMTIERLERA